MGAGNFDPFDDFERMHRRFEGLIRHLLHEPSLPSRLGTQPYWTPAVDVYETDTHYIILAELAGVNREHMEVSLKGERLTLRGERHEPPSADPKQRLHRMEVDYGSFLRMIDLPEAPDSDAIEAQYENGFLQIRIRRRGVHRPVVVEVESGGK